MNVNDIKKKELHDTPWKYVEDKMLNSTTEEMYRKSLPGFPYTSKWHALELDRSQSIEPDNGF